MSTRSLELLLDDATDADIRAQWQRLIDADLPSAGRHPGASNAPHVTLLACSTPIPGADGLRELAGLPLPLTLGGLLLFGAGRAKGGVVLARAVVATDALLALHARVHELAGVDAVPNTRPGVWTPHVTLARRIAPEQLAAALPLLGEGDGSTAATSLRLWDAETAAITHLAPSVG